MSYVKFTDHPGLVSRRIITVDDLKAAGLVPHEDQKDFVFDRNNRFMMDTSEWPDEIVDFFKAQPDFTVSDSDKAPVLASSINFDDQPFRPEPGSGPALAVAGTSGPSVGGSTASTAGVTGTAGTTAGRGGRAKP